MKEKLSHFHATILIYMIQSGVVIFSLPQQLALHFGTNGWLVLCIIFVIVSLNIGLISIVYRLGMGRSILVILEQSIPKFILYPFYLVFMFVWAMGGCLLAKQYVLVFQMIAFPATNAMYFKLAIDVLFFFLLIKGVYNIAKAATVFFWLVIWTVLFLFFFYADFQWVRLTPFLFQDSEITVNGFMSIYSGFLGYELCLFLFPYVDKKTRLMRSTFLGNLLLTINYLYFAIICFGFFSLAQLKDLRFPLIETLSYIQLPLVQAVGSLVFGVFLLSVTVTSVMYFWSAKEVGKRIFPISDKLLSFLIVFTAYIISFIPQELTELRTWSQYFNYIEGGIAFGLPVVLILLLVSKGRKRGEIVGE